jgi:hypothetical protein
MLDAQVKNLWLLGIISCPIVLAIFTTLVGSGGASSSFSVGHFVGAGIANFVMGSLPALIAGIFYGFKKEKQKDIFWVWTAGILMTSLLIFLGTLKS